MWHSVRLVPALNCVIIFAAILIAFSLHAQDTNEGSDLVSDTPEQEVMGICARTSQVQTALLDKIDGVSDCGVVTVAHLSSITVLSLNNSGITTLQSDDFSGLSGLETLRLKDNSLSALPANVFSGLTSLNRLDLRGNPGSDFTLTLQLDRTDDADDAAQGPATIVVKVAEGAPFDMTVGLSATGGTLSSSNVTIAKGSTQSSPITVTQTGMVQATVSLGAAPALPVNYRGIQTAVGNPLVLFESAVQTRGFFLSLDLDGSDGDQAVQSLAVLPPSGNQIIFIQIFGTDIQNAFGFSARFEYDVTQVVYEGFDAGDVLPNPLVISEEGTGFVEINIASWSGGSATVNSGLMGTLRFRTTNTFGGTTIQLVHAELGRNDQFESLRSDGNFELEITKPSSPDIDGSGVVDISDFLLFVGRFEASNETYLDRFDLDGNGKIGFSDFFVFSNNFGKTAPVAVSALVPVTLGMNPVTVDVSDNFNDANSDVLHYTAVSSANAIATARVAGSEVTISPVDAGSAKITVIATNAGGLSATQDIAVTVQLAMGFEASRIKRAVDENTLPGEKIGDPVAVMSFASRTYRLSGVDADLFVIDSSSGQIRTREGVTYDYEDKRSYWVKVVMMDQQYRDLDSIVVTINVNDVNEPPSSIPSNFLVVPGDRSLSIHYSPCIDEPDKPPIRGYHAELRTGTDGDWGNRKTIYGRNTATVYYTKLNVPRYHDPDLINGQLYQVRVCAYNSEGAGDWSAPVSGTPESRVVSLGTEFERFQGTENLVYAEIDLSNITGAGGRITVSQAALPVHISPAQAEGIFLQAAIVNSSYVPHVSAGMGFTILEGSPIFDIELKVVVNKRRIDIGDELMEPVEICLPVTADISRPFIIRYSDEWKILENQRVDGNEICALTDGFSLFGVGVKNTPKLSFGGVTIADQAYKQNAQITDLVLPTASGGTAPITYALSPETNGTPNLPAGLSFNANTRTISSTPSAAFPMTTFTWTATDADNDTAELMFDITVLTGICARTSQVQAAILDEIDGVSDCGLVTSTHLSSVETLSLNNKGITSLQSNDFSGLSGLETLRLKDNSLSALPANVFSGLMSLRRLDLRGNPGSDFTLTLVLDRTDDADDTASGPATVVVKVAEGAPFDMTVSLSATGGTLSPSSVTIAKGSTQSGPITVTQTGVVQATVSMGAAPAVPEGYGAIQTAVGNSLVLFTSSVLHFGGATIADQAYKQNAQITDLVLPTATGGTAPITYALSPETNGTPDLPAGLSFNANTHTISGIPSAVFSTTEFTWTATDADNATAELMFDITVPIGICARTSQVRTAILDEIDGVSDCGLVTLADLFSVTTLSLNNSGITTLQSDDFSGLTSLTNLRLKDNSLSALPVSVFSGLTSLTRLDLRGNPGSDFTLTLELDRTDDADDTASGPATVVVKVAEGAPFDMTVGLSVTGGTLSPSSSVTIAKGSTQSGSITVTQAGMVQATVSLGAAPALPQFYRGITTAVGNPLVLFPVVNGAPVKVGTIAAQTLTEGGVAVTVDVSGNFSDPENDPLTYSATSDDEDVATVSVQGSMVTISPVGAGSATVTVMALDATGSNMSVDQTIAVIVLPAGLSFGGATIAAQTYKQNAQITDLILPTATGGTAPITYALSPETNGTPDLPAGLSFNANTRTISGTPLAVFSTTEFTWTATDAANTTAELMFDITVPIGICSRTTQVRDEILDEIDGVSDCGLVTLADLSSVTLLSLNNSGITALQSDDFSNLSSLTNLRLKDNSLSALPASVFSGLTSLTRLDLRGNPGSDFTLTLALDRTDDADDASQGPATIVVKVAEGAPFDMTVGLSVTGGTLSSSSVTIAKGSTQSSSVTATQTGMVQATVSMGAAPALPANYRGIATAVGAPLVLFPVVNRAPEKIGTIAAQSLTESAAAVTVDVSSNFSDPENDPLTYSATSDDEDVATVSVQGSMVTISPVGAGSTTVTVTALDATGSNMSVDQTIAVTVLPAGLSFGSATIADQTYKQNAQITDLVLPTATGGTAPITYALSPETNGTPDLPAGLGFNANTHTISGIPSAAFSTTEFTWTATDADNATAELMFDITIPIGICSRTSQVQAAILDDIGGVSDCGLVTLADLSSVTTLSLNNSGITALQSDDFSGLSSLTNLRLKDNSLSALPASVFSGLSSLNRLDLRGNPGSDFTLTLQLDRTDDADDASQGPATIVVKVAEGAPFDMTVGLSATGSTLSPSSSVTIAKGSTQSGAITVTQSGMGQATVSLDAAPALPTGDNVSYRGIATAVGVPLVLFPVVNRAPEKVGTIAAQSLTESAAAVTVDVSSNFSDPENDPLTYSATSDDEDVVTVSVQGSMVTISPVGAGSATVTVTALDATGSNTSVDQTIAVTVLPAGLSFGGETIADQIYKQNAQITDLVLPTATGGTAPITYALSPETNGTPNLPAGLGFNANTHTISGTPLAVFSTTEFTWTATDAANTTAELMFDITVPAGICSRTSQVQVAILDDIGGVSDCGLVTVADLSSVTLLSLNNSGITSLQFDDFSGLTSLETLRLKDNSLSALPASVFSGLTSLNRLDLRGNPGSAFTLTLQLDRTDDADDAAQGPATVVVKVAEGAPFDMTVGLSATGGTLSPSSVTIAKGSTQSGSITVTQTGMGQATVSLDAAPALPANYRGIATAVGNSLVLFPVVNRAPEKVGTVAAQSLTEGAAAVTVDVSGNFSDPENDPLTYSATSDDEDVATVSVQGSVVTISPVGAGSATVTVTALDATGSNMSVDQTIAVTVNPVGICSRTSQVQTAILDQIDGVSDCGVVTVAHLSSITVLSLNNSGITTLQSDDFSGVLSLEILRLKDNSLSALPAGVFSGLTSLNRLDLRGNPGSAFTLTLQLDRTDDTDDTAQGPATIVVKVSEGAPFDMTVGLSATDGTLSSSTVTISKGSTQSGPITVTQTGVVQTTVSLGAAPALPNNYRGIQTAVGSPLVLF